ncbi:outer membrane beta-barrel protein [Psychrobacter arenosus]|jgi:opacity protein-like surface antigen|uniref:outer membrane beta-barrel protein n=1 Tax=Psychrobacter arenosus TaxID=256326 RepID=UPI00191A2020|nr:outer membrane beta-barrel protein [Psychrobacter arenosus]
MKTLQKTILALATGSLLSMGAQAAVSYAGQPYAGVKVGQYSPDLDDNDDATSYGVYGGYKMANNFGVEAEYLGTDDADSYEDALYKEEYSGKVYGLYGTYDYTFPNTNLYAKGRLGVAKNEVKATNTFKPTGSTESDKYSDTGLAGGLGLGYNVTPMASVEAMYNMYPTIEASNNDDVDVSGITLGAHLKF